MFEKPIDFDRFVRMLITAGLFILTYFFLNELSSVLLPFFLAWLTAYMLEPLVLLIQRLVKKRIIAVLSSLFLIVGVITMLIVVLTPIVIDEVLGLQSLLASQINSMSWPAWIPKDIGEKINDYISGYNYKTILAQEGFVDKAASILSGGWNVISSAFGVLGALFGTITYALYVVFIMLDYSNISSSWKKLIPDKYKDFSYGLISDMEAGMNGYFKAQTNIVIVVAILFSIGFSIIGMPFAILLGITLAVGLTALHCLETGDNFWVCLGLVLLVFTVIQLAQDLYLTPKFMGSFSGFNPAVILLSLSVWGSLLGVMGLIIGIPLTSILLSYYERYILKSKS